MVEEYLKLPTTKTYYDYGSKTFLLPALVNHIEKIEVMECSENQHLNNEAVLHYKSYIKEGKIKLNYVDVGICDTEGFPLKFNMGLNYYTHIDKLEYVPDVIMISGRWRVECALHVFNKANEDTIILFYDYEKEEYQGLFAAYYIEKAVGKLARLSKKKDEVIPSAAFFFYQMDPR
jgi:hypothetical protein